MRIRVFLIALLCIFLMAGSAMAAKVKDEKTPSVGAQFQYSFVPSTFLSPAYEKFTSIAAYGYGVYCSYGLTQFDLQWSVKNYGLSIGDGEWRVRGDKEIDTYHVEANLGMATVDMSILWKWRIHPAVEPYIGPTVGFGFVYGQLEVDESDENGNPLNDPSDKQVPPVIPLGGFVHGWRFYPAPMIRLSVDFGLFSGFFAGATAGYVF
ncbi:MAG: hypothetical protein P9L99_20045 [Candidatus Lernaella stagnicola]|nr:hypothetical protein [Candidatus Lernaella stagnicola]